jgi:hypothetical protein
MGSCRRLDHINCLALQVITIFFLLRQWSIKAEVYITEYFAMLSMKPRGIVSFTHIKIVIAATSLAPDVTSIVHMAEYY